MPYSGIGGLFGAPALWGATKPYQSGAFAKMGMGQQQQQPAPQQPNKRWLEGGKFGWKDGLALALGAIGDARTGRPQTSQMILGSMQQRRQSEERQRLFEQQRKAGLEDYRTQKQIDYEYAAPPKPPAIQQNADYIRATRGDKAADDYLDNYGRGLVQPNVVAIPGLGTFYGTPEEVTAAITAARGGGSDPVEAEMRRRGLM